MSGCVFLNEAIKSVTARKKGLFFSPFVPQFHLLSLPKQCQLALLWQLAGAEKQAGQLAHWLLSFAWENPPFSLWCREKEYNEDEGYFSFYLLMRALGDEDRAAKYLEKVRGEVAPFLLELQQEKVPIIENSDDPFPTISQIPNNWVLSLQGNGTTMGMVRNGDVEIRAFGPQSLPLNGSQGFGVSRGEGNWTSSFAHPEIWIEVKSTPDQLHLKFVGLRPEMPMAFAFYVKAQSCQIGSNVYKPKSLKRFHGEAKGAHFQGIGTQLFLECSQYRKIQMIPLAGEGCFWNSEFLVLFENQSFDEEIKFSINYSNK